MSMPSVRAVAAVSAAALLASCAAPPPPPAAPEAPPRDYVVLLENADGSTGRVVYTADQGTVELAQARQAVALRGPATPSTVDAGQLERDIGAAVAAQPRAPRTFIFYFDANNARINQASEALIPEVLEEVRSRPSADVSITGHTDTAGDAQRNEILSLRRAEYVAGRLKSATTSALAVEVTSHGERNLLVPTADGVDEPRNRRVEVVVR
mgnify:CR=1 FL=1